MKTRLLPILFTALLTSCEKQMPPPVRLRLQVTPTRICDDTGPVPGVPAGFTEWLSARIAQHRVDPDVRLDYTGDVTARRLASVLDSLSTAGAFSTPGILAIHQQDSADGDTRIHFSVEKIDQGCVSQTPVADSWGEFLITGEQNGSFVDFDLECSDSALFSDDIALTLDEAAEMLQARQSAGELRITVIAAPEEPMANIIPVFSLCIRSGATIQFCLRFQEEKDLPPRQRELGHAVSRKPPCAAPVLRPAKITPPVIPPPLKSQPAVWFPIQFQMWSDCRGLCLGYGRGRGAAQDLDAL